MQRTTLTRDDLAQLLGNTDFPKVSITMPTRPTGPEAKQNPIRLGNLVAAAHEQLQARNAKNPEKLLAPIEELVRDADFWAQPGGGLAVFASENLFWALHLPLTFTELAVVNDRFHIKQLLPYFDADQAFYLLAVSLNAVRVFRCTGHGSEQLEVPGMPRDKADAMRFEVYEKHLQFKGGAGLGATRGKMRVALHGMGTHASDHEADELRRYFQAIDRTLAPVLRGRKAPLVLAGVAEYLPVYRRVNSYPHLVDAIVPGSPDRADVEVLRRKAMDILAPHFAARLQADRERLARLMGTGLASDQVAEVVPAAVYGRVEMLFVARGVRAWGRFDHASGQVEVRDAQKPGDQDLLDLAAAHALLGGATVHTLPPEDMPGEALLAGVFRY